MGSSWGRGLPKPGGRQQGVLERALFLPEGPRFQERAGPTGASGDTWQGLCWRQEPPLCSPPVRWAEWRSFAPHREWGPAVPPAASPSPGVHLQGDPLTLTLAPTHCSPLAGCPVTLPCLPLSHFKFHLLGLPTVCRPKSGTQGPPHRGSPLLNIWHYFQTFIHLLILILNLFFFSLEKMETFQKDIQLVKVSCNLRSQIASFYFIKIFISLFGRWLEFTWLVFSVHLKYI